MPRLVSALRALGLALVLLAASSCVPWPPRPESCIEVTRGGRRSPPSYYLAGQPASREQVEAAVSASPGGAAGIEQAHALFTVGLGGMIGGLVAGSASTGAAIATGRTGFVVLSLASALTTLVSFVILINRDAPFRAAVNDYNRAAEQHGTCRRWGE